MYARHDESNPGTVKPKANLSPIRKTCPHASCPQTPTKRTNEDAKPLRGHELTADEWMIESVKGTEKLAGIS